MIEQTVFLKSAENQLTLYHNSLSWQITYQCPIYTLRSRVKGAGTQATYVPHTLGSVGGDLPLSIVPAQRERERESTEYSTVNKDSVPAMIFSVQPNAQFEPTSHS